MELARGARNGVSRPQMRNAPMWPGMEAGSHTSYTTLCSWATASFLSRFWRRSPFQLWCWTRGQPSLAPLGRRCHREGATPSDPSQLRWRLS